MYSRLTQELFKILCSISTLFKPQGPLFNFYCFIIPQKGFALTPQSQYLELFLLSLRAQFLRLLMI